MKVLLLSVQRMKEIVARVLAILFRRIRRSRVRIG